MVVHPSNSAAPPDVWRTTRPARLQRHRATAPVQPSAIREDPCSARRRRPTRRAPWRQSGLAVSSPRRHTPRQPTSGFRRRAGASSVRAPASGRGRRRPLLLRGRPRVGGRSSPSMGLRARSPHASQNAIRSVPTVSPQAPQLTTGSAVGRRWPRRRADAARLRGWASFARVRQDSLEGLTNRHLLERHPGDAHRLRARPGCNTESRAATISSYVSLARSRRSPVMPTSASEAAPDHRSPQRRRRRASIRTTTISASGGLVGAGLGRNPPQRGHRARSGRHCAAGMRASPNAP